MVSDQLTQITNHYFLMSVEIEEMESPLKKLSLINQ